MGSPFRLRSQHLTSSPKASSLPLNNSKVALKNSGIPIPDMDVIMQGVENINNNTQIDPSFNPKPVPNRNELLDMSGNPFVEGVSRGYGGYNEGGRMYKPTVGILDLHASGDLYAQRGNTELRDNLIFDPKTGYSARPLDIQYEKDEDGIVRTAYLGGDKTYRMNNPRERKEFEDIRQGMYEDQQNLLNRNQANFVLGNNPNMYINGYNRAPYGENNNVGNWREELYNSQAYGQEGNIGAPGSKEREVYLQALNNYYKGKNSNDARSGSRNY